MLRWLSLVIASGIVVLTSDGTALAQSRRAKAGDASEPVGYKEAIGTAIGEFDRNNYVEAREHFARAHALFPNARTLRGLGMTEFELKGYVAATQYLERALASVTKPLEGLLRDETAKLLASARQYVGTLRLSVNPPTTHVTIDGVAVELDEENSVRLAVGDHLVELRAEGRLPERRAIQTRGEQLLELRVHLATLDAKTVADAPPKSAPLAPAEQPPSQPAPVYKKWWLWTTVGVVAVGGAVAAILLTRKVEHPEEATTTPNTPPNAALQPLWSH